MAARPVDETKTGLRGCLCHSQPIQVSEAWQRAAGSERDLPGKTGELND